MSTRKTTLFYALLIAVSSLAVGMVIASRLDLSPTSSAQTLARAADEQRAGHRRARRADVPQRRQGAVADGREHPHRDAAALAGPVRLLRRRRRRQAPDDLLRRFFGSRRPGGREPTPTSRTTARGRNEPPPREQTTVAAGTGFIISKDGLILTNNHVVEGASKIEVSLFGEDHDQLYQAKLVGRDALTDSALIQLTEKPNHPLPEAKFGDSSQMAAGDWVMAIGNPFNFRAWTVTVGVISATERAVPGDRRPLERDDPDRRRDQPGQLRRSAAQPARRSHRHEHGDLQQRPGRGQHRHRLRGADQHHPRSAAAAAHRQGDPRPHRRADVGGAARGLRGLRPEDRAPARSCRASLPAAPPRRPASKPGDVIVEFNGRPVTDTSELQKMVTATKPGTSVPVKVMRDKKERTLQRHRRRARPRRRADRSPVERTTPRNEPAEQGGDSFGLTLSNLTPQMARRLQMPSGQTGAVITDVDPNGPSAGALRQGDVILAVNRHAGRRAPPRPAASCSGCRRAASRRSSCLARRRRSVRHGQEGIAEPCEFRRRLQTADYDPQPLIQIVRERGPLTVAAFMDLALYHPELGYYARAAQRSGRAGDFFTSVDVGPLFGELLEVQIAEMARLLAVEPHWPTRSTSSKPAPATAGSPPTSCGAAERRHPDAYAGIRLHLVEASAAARAAQRPSSATAADRLVASSDQLPAAFEGVLVANELLDAMPVHQVVMRAEGLREVYVDRRAATAWSRSRANRPHRTARVSRSPGRRGSRTAGASRSTCALATGCPRSRAGSVAASSS